MKLEKLALIGALSVGSMSPALTSCKKESCVEQSDVVDVEAAAPKVAAEELTCMDLKRNFHERLESLDGVNHPDKSASARALSAYLELQNTLQQIRTKCDKELSVPSYAKVVRFLESKIDCAISMDCPAYRPTSSTSDNTSSICSEGQK